MLLFCRDSLTDADREKLIRAARDAGFHAQPTGDRRIVLFGDGDAGALAGLPGVERVEPAPTSPVLAGLSAPNVVEVAGVRFGEGTTVVAGPCAVESRERLLAIARAAKDAGADMLRGGAYKPRTSPYSFQGLREAGLAHLVAAREETGLPVVTEVLDTRDVEAVADVADMLQIGTRNMMSYALLTEAGKAGKPVLLKRGMSATIPELIWAAEYLLLGGCPGVVLCERGLRTFTHGSRFTLDLSVVPAVRRRSRLPLVVDPSHAAGDRGLVPALARAAAGAGADGVMIEIHSAPDCALCDGPQALSPGLLPALIRQIRRIGEIARETLDEEAS